MTRAIAAFLILCSLGALPAAAADPTEAVISKDLYRTAQWGYLVADLASGQVLAEKNADHCFAAASTTKLFTAAAALEAFGADHRLVTRIVHSGRLAADGRLTGDLILLAAGDLTLNGRALPDGTVAFADVDHSEAQLGGARLTEPDPLAGLDDLARQTAAAGVRRLEGRVLVDARLFPTGRPEGKHYVMSPMVVNDNLVDLTITPGAPGQPASVAWRPACAALTVESKVLTGKAGSEVDLRTAMPSFGRLEVRGTVPPGAPVVWAHQMEDPVRWARVLLAEALARAGVALGPQALTGDDGAVLPPPEKVGGLPTVAKIASPPLAETVKLILKTSHNLGADLLPMLLAASRGQAGMEAGMKIEGQILRGMGLDTSGISLADGEGGEVADQLSPRGVVALLRLAAGRPWYQAYRRALPVLGVDGTLAKAVGPDDPARGKVWAKTGTRVTIDLLNWRMWLSAKGLAGYLEGASGRQLVFAVYVNEVPADDLAAAMAVGRDLAALTGLWRRAF